MIKRVVTTRQADLDIDEAVDYYLSQAAFDAATRFVDRLDATKSVIAEHPSLGSARYADDARIPSLQNVTLPDFPYIIFYTDDADAVRIHRVPNTSRDLFAVLGQG